MMGDPESSTKSSQPIVSSDLPVAAPLWMPDFVISLKTLDLILNTILPFCQVFNIFGIVSNIINMTVFRKLGLTDSPTICMFALSLSDFWCCVLFFWSCLAETPAFRDSNIPISSTEISLLTGTSTRGFLSKTTAFIMAYISIERCLCVLFPLKCKTIITPRRTVIAMVIIFLVTVGPSLNFYYYWKFEYKFYPHRNKTLLGVTYSGDLNNISLVEKIIVTVCGSVYLIAAFLIIVLSTVVLVVKLRKSSKFRDQHKLAGSEPHVSKVKEDRLSKMLLVMAIIFLVCNFPNIVATLIYGFLPGWNMTGIYHRLVVVVNLVAFLADTVNSSVNIFVYYRMGSHYRTKLRQITRCCKPGDKHGD